MIFMRFPLPVLCRTALRMQGGEEKTVKHTLGQEHLDKNMLEQLTLRWEAWEAEATTTAKKIVRARLHLLFLLIRYGGLRLGEALGLNARETGLPLVLISDGRLLTQNLTARGYDQVWLKKQLSRQGIRQCSQVFLMTVDEAGGVYLVPQEKQEEGGGKR